MRNREMENGKKVRNRRRMERKKKEGKMEGKEGRKEERKKERKEGEGDKIRNKEIKNGKL